MEHMVPQVSNMKPSMQSIWMQAAYQLSKRSECSKSQVGCIVTTKDLRHVLGNGYNGYARGIDYNCKPDTCNCLHAENNALLDASSDIKDKVVFITMFPCLKCAIQIVNSGCSKVYFNRYYKLNSHHWSDVDIIKDMFDKSNIECELI